MTTTQREVFGKPMMRVTDAAALYGIHPNTLRRSIRNGQTRAIKVAGTWYIPVSDIEAQRKNFEKQLKNN